MTGGNMTGATSTDGGMVTTVVMVEMEMATEMAEMAAVTDKTMTRDRTSTVNIS